MTGSGIVIHDDVITSLFMMVRPGRGLLWVILLLIAANMIMFAAMVSYWFTGWDTLSLIYTASVSSLADCVTRPVMFATSFLRDGLYFRPVVALLFWIQYRLFGLHPGGYFAVNLVCHIASVVLVARVAARIYNSNRAGLLAGAILTAHPMVLENVPVVSRGQDVIATAFVLGMLYLFLEKRYWRGTLVYALALLSKEVGIVALAMAAAVLWWQREDWRKIIPLVGVTGIYLVWRVAALGMVSGGYSDSWDKLAVSLSMMFYYPGYITTPWGIDQQIDSFSELLLIIVGVAVVGVAAWRLREDRRIRLTGLFVVLPALLFAGLGTLQYWYFYLPVAMASLFLSIVILEMWQRRRQTATSILALILLAIAVNRPALATWQRVGAVNQNMLRQIENSHLGDILFVYRAPAGMRTRTGGVRGVHFLQDHSVTSYLRLRGNDNTVVRFVTMAELSDIPDQATACNQGGNIIRWQYDTAIVDIELHHSWK